MLKEINIEKGSLFMEAENAKTLPVIARCMPEDINSELILTINKSRLTQSPASDLVS